jgi:hypothetical protein
VKLGSPTGSAAGGSVNLSTSLSNVGKLAANPKFDWVFNANCDGTIIYNNPVHILIRNPVFSLLYCCCILLESYMYFHFIFSHFVLCI